MSVKHVFIAAAIVFVPSASHAQIEDKILDLMKESAGKVQRQQQEAGKTALCPEGWECAAVANFVKGDYRGEAKKFPLGHLTAERGYTRLVVQQHIGGEHGVIINTVKVRQGGKWIPYVQGLRLPEGRTELAVPVPAGTPEIVISFDHGQGAEVNLLLERPVR